MPTPSCSEADLPLGSSWFGALGLIGSKSGTQRTESLMRVLGNIVCLVGSGIWVLGYLFGGPDPFYAWPWWAFLPNLVTEVGAALCIIGSVFAFWPGPSNA